MTAHYPRFFTPSRPSRPVRRKTFYECWGKRLADLTLVVCSVPFVLPIILILAALVACDGHRPFFFQTRVGKSGRRFRMWKLRSMVADAENRLDAHLRQDPAARKEWQDTQKLQNDPRITRLGRILRKTSLDELPQLWNVLTGDMSLVGPRPMMPCQQALYPGEAYYNLRPGLTGFWQISDRNRTSFAARAEYDSLYELDLSFRTDVRILCKTLDVVRRGTGC